MPNFKKLKEHVDKLSLLLDDPQEGLQSWCMMVASEWKNISFLWTGPSDSPDNLKYIKNPKNKGKEI